jgi:TPR repeat protein
MTRSRAVRLTFVELLAPVVVIACSPSCSAVTNSRSELAADCSAKDENACLSLGYMMLKGQDGRRSPQGALEQFERACALGNSIGCKKAGDLWKSGEAGFANPRKAEMYYLMARELDTPGKR